jgi:glycosyltransferase involved in cell wall biosynthesis
LGQLRTAAVRTVHFVAPDGIDDPARASGGNTYDRKLCRALASTGWSVREHPVPGFWSPPDGASLAALAEAVRRIPNRAVVLFDGLVASTAPDVLVPQGRRLRLVVLVHMPLGHRPPEDHTRTIRMRERAMLSAAAAVITTSVWSRRRLIELYRLPGDRIHVAEPGVDPAERAAGTATGEALLSVAAVIPDKGHDVLLEGLASATDLSWHCVCVGSLDRDPAFVDALRRYALNHGLAARVSFPGVATGTSLHRAYHAADVMVLASRAETYGMAVTEALARGLPVITTNVGGVAEALGHGTDEVRPGLLIPPDDPEALADALRSWLGDAELRAWLRKAARDRRRSLRGWSTTTSTIVNVLVDVDQ